jgi:hypothetical protein
VRTLGHLPHGGTPPGPGERLLLCLGYRLDLKAAALSPHTDIAQLNAVADLTPTQRLDHALASRASLDGLLGAARDR